MTTTTNPPTATIKAVEFTSVRATFRPKPLAMSTAELLLKLQTHVRVEDKTSSALFSPVVLAPVPAGTCRHAAHPGQTKPHRCDASVECVTLLVFDADQGTEADVADCYAALTASGVRHVFYSTHSYHPGKAIQSYRLVIFPDRAIKPEEFKNLRLNLIQKFSIPCDPGSSAGVSHSYYWPTAKPGAPTQTLVHDGAPLSVDQYLGELTSVVAPTLYTDKEVAEGHQPSMEALRAACEARATSKWVSGGRTGALLQRMLQGEELGRPGERHAAVIALRGVLCGMFTDVSVDVLYGLAAASLARTSLGTDRDFALEFAQDIEGYQGELFAKDEARIEALKPPGYALPPTPTTAALGDLVPRGRAITTAFIKHYVDKGDQAKAALVRAAVKGQPIASADLNRLLWIVTARWPGQHPITYVETLWPSTQHTVYGKDRQRQLVTEALYKQEAARREEETFTERMRARRDARVAEETR